MNTTTYSIVIFFLCVTLSGVGQNLEDGFKNPPQPAKPRTWMHAMSGNMSKEGMTKDLEALEAAGQGGVLLFNIAVGVPYGKIAYNSDEHHDIIAHAAKECERLNLSFGVHNCDGWSSSGGPWIKPEQSMKMISCSETLIQGGKNKIINLPLPTIRANYYEDIAVLAYPSLENEIIDAKIKPILTASDKNFDISIATDGLTDKITTISSTNNQDPWLLFDFGKPHAIQTVYIPTNSRYPKALLETSDDGKNFTLVKELKVTRTTKIEWVVDDQFDPIKARFFRVKFKNSSRSNSINKTFDILEARLRSLRLFDNYVKYTGFSNIKTDNAMPFKEPTANMVIQKEDILNISSSLRKDGTLDVNLPEGNWTILRFVMTSTGAVNKPASIWGKGLECDKFSREAYKTHFDAFCQRVIDKSKPNALNALQYIEIDSYESGGQNWTNGFENIFKKEKGYDIIPFLPIYTGRYVESAKTVMGFTYDINDLYCKLMNENYYKYFTELCNENGLKSYVEPYGNGPVSTLDISGNIDLPMTEFWMNRGQDRMSGTISGAHIYGKNIISAESFTSKPNLNWKMHPALAKASGDEAWTGGVNEFMFHRFVHQANTHVKPGVTMGPWGSHIDRTQTWWMNAGASWFKYIARGSYLLRQGYPVADILVFMGDGSHKNGITRRNVKPSIPMGLNYDTSNADVLLNRLSIKNKALVLPEGNRYHYLVLNHIDLIELSTLKRIKEIIDAGIVVIGNKPSKLAGYLNSLEDQVEFKKLCDYIWEQPNCKEKFDFSKVQSDFSVKGAQLKFVHRKTEDSDIYFFHNKDKKAISYECTFRVANKIPELWDANTGKITKLANFKSEGALTKLWIDFKPLESAFIIFRESSTDINSIVSIAKDKQFSLKDKNTVVLETKSSKASSILWSNGKKTVIPALKFPETIDLSTQWDVTFLKEHNFDAKKKFSKLIDWKDSENDSIRHYSGTAVYNKDFKIGAKKKWLRYILDLGEVNVVAEVIVNGKNAGVLWLAPFEVDITDYLQKGDNQLRVKITNQWSNRLIGDENYPEHKGTIKTGYVPKFEEKMPDWYVNNEPMPKGLRTTFSTGRFYNKGDELMPSGLKGPVILKYKRVIEINNK